MAWKRKKKRKKKKKKKERLQLSEKLGDHGERFNYIKMQAERFQNWGGPWSGFHLLGNMERMVFTEWWSLVLGSSIWKCEENDFYRGVGLSARFIYMEM